MGKLLSPTWHVFLIQKMSIGLRGKVSAQLYEGLQSALEAKSIPTHDRLTWFEHIAGNKTE